MSINPPNVTLVIVPDDDRIGHYLVTLTNLPPTYVLSVGADADTTGFDGRQLLLTSVSGAPADQLSLGIGLPAGTEPGLYYMHVELRDDRGAVLARSYAPGDAIEVRETIPPTAPPTSVTVVSGGTAVIANTGTASGANPVATVAPAVMGVTLVPDAAAVMGVITVADSGAEAALVARLYEGTLGRGASGIEVGLRLSQLADGIGVVALADAIAGSAESLAAAADTTGLVTLLYARVLGRSPGAGEVDGWGALLDAGGSRGTVALGIALSAEALQRDQADGDIVRVVDVDMFQVSALYEIALDRKGDAAGLASWTAVSKAGATLAAMAFSFAGSAEFAARTGGMTDAAFIEFVYRSALDRDADPAGLAAWVAQLNAGASRADVIAGFAASDEYVGKAMAEHAAGILFA